MTSLGSVAVFCGSSPGNDPIYARAARGFGAALARRGLRLVYGGGHVGLMGEVADGALEAGGDVVGVITRALAAHEVAHRGLATLQVVETMHERKATMADLADAFVMLPGGFGTWDEFMEAVTWTQLGIHAKPCGVLEVGDFFAPLHALIDAARAARFVAPAHADLVLFAATSDELLEALARFEAPKLTKWLDRGKR